MFNENKDRIDYGKALTPPENYEVDFAVGTTYSLSLEAFLSVLIPLGLAEENDSDLVHDKIYWLNVLNSLSDKVIVFADSSQIQIPKSHKVADNPLLLLLEKMVIPVSTKKDESRIYPSFHPKCWFITYKNKDDNSNKKYRLIVLSRNLTFDRSWDISIVLDGEINSSTQSTESEPLISFLAYLQEQAKDYIGLLNPLTEAYNLFESKIELIEKMKSSLNYVEYSLKDSVFDSYRFLPLGIGEKGAIRNESLFKDEKDELVIMSPFISTEVLEGPNSLGEKTRTSDILPVLITRETELPKFNGSKPEKFKTYIIKNKLLEGEKEISTEEIFQARCQDIHAKIIVSKVNTRTNLYLGSMNTSTSAVDRNIEFNILLECDSSKFEPITFLNELAYGNWLDDKNNPFTSSIDFTKYSSEDLTGAEEEKKFVSLMKEICRSIIKTSITEEHEEFTINVFFSPLELFDDYKVTIAPLGNETIVNDFCTDMHFSGLLVNQLSEFFVVTITNLITSNKFEKVILIPCEIPFEKRDTAIINEIVKTKDDF